MSLRAAVVVLFGVLGATLRADVVLWNNGPIVNEPFAGAGGAHASRVQDEVGLTTIGFGAAISTPSNETYVDLVEDFTVDTPGGWYVSSLTLFTMPFQAPQTSGPVAAQILDGPPWAGGVPVFSGATAGATPLGAYRVPGNEPLGTAWPISARTLAVGVTLLPGQYWIVWDPDSSAFGFKAQAPPVTVNGQTVTGTAWTQTTLCGILGCQTSPWEPLHDDSGTGALQGLPFVIKGRPVSARKGNFDGQHGPDLVLRNVNVASPDFNRNELWFMNGVTRLDKAFVTPDPSGPAWTVVGTDDFDTAGAPWNGPDGKTDLLFRDTTSGALEFWLMNGAGRAGPPLPVGGFAPPPPQWQLAATGDVNADGQPDLVWRHAVSQKIVVWVMNGTSATETLLPTPDQAVNGNWAIVAAQDYNDDGSTDFLWYNSTSGRIVTWYMDAALRRVTGQFVNPPAAGDHNWKVLASSDYSGTSGPGTPPLNSCDVVWRNETSGRLVIWHLDFASTRVFGQFTNPDSATPALDWTVVGPK